MNEGGAKYPHFTVEGVYLYTFKQIRFNQLQHPRHGSPIAMANSTKGTSPFRDHLPDLSQDRFMVMQKQNAHEYVKAFKDSATPPWLHALYLHWRCLLAEPYKGVTNDGKRNLEAA